MKLYSSEHNTAERAVAVTVLVRAMDIWSHHSMMLAPPKGILLNLKSMLGLEDIRHFTVVENAFLENLIRVEKRYSFIDGG